MKGNFFKRFRGFIETCNFCKSFIVVFNIWLITACASPGIDNVQLNISKLSSSTQKILLVVEPFTFKNHSEADSITTLFTKSLRESNIATRVYKGDADSKRNKAAEYDKSYYLQGEIQKYDIGKNWVPTFFPLSMAACLFTIGIAQLLGFPTTAEHGKLKLTVRVFDLQTDEEIAVFTKATDKTMINNIYTDEAASPYKHPELIFAPVFAPLIEEIANEIS